MSVWHDVYECGESERECERAVSLFVLNSLFNLDHQVQCHPEALRVER